MLHDSSSGDCSSVLWRLRALMSVLLVLLETRHQRSISSSGEDTGSGNSPFTTIKGKRAKKV